MYRLLTLTTNPFRKYPNVTFTSSFVNREPSEKVCVLCKQLQNLSRIYTRRQSTSLYEHIRRDRKKRKVTKKKYSDVVMVSENSSKQQKATIQKLTSKDVKLLVNSSLNLNELYKLKDNKFIEEHSYNDIRVIESAALLKDNLLPELNEEQEDEHLEVEPEIELNRVHRLNSFQPEVLDEHPETEIETPKVTKERKTTAKTENLLLYRDEIVTNTLAAFVEICGVLKTPQRGLNALNFHRHRTGKFAKRYKPLQDAKVYNALLKAFAVRGSYDKCVEVLNIAKEDNVELNVHTYAILLECLGRINTKNNHLKDIRTIVNEAKRHGFTFDQIMNECVFLNDERSLVLKAMKAFDSSYEPTYHKPSLQYKNHLVNCLNNDEQLNWKGFKKDSKNTGLFTRKSLNEAIDKQIELEKIGYITINSVATRAELSDEVLEYRKVLQEHYKMWEQCAHTAFIRDLSTLTAQRSAISFEPYMRSIPAKEFVTIIVDEARKLAQGSETYSPTVHLLHRTLGSKVYARYMVLRKQKVGVLDKIKTIHSRYCDEYATVHKSLDILPNEEMLINARQQWQLIENENLSKGATLAMGHQEWVPSVLQFIGKFLYHIIMHDLQIDVNALRLKDKNRNYLPAFYTIFRNQGRIVKEEVKPHPILSRLYRQSQPETLTFPTCEVPMICPPVPWICTETGGFLLMPSDVMRLPSQAHTPKKRLLEAAPEDLYPSLDALNQLAAVPWKVNERMLDTILEVFNNGGSSRLDVPEPTSALSPPPAATSEMEKSERYKIFRQRLQYRRKKAEMYGLWCDCLYRLSLANHFREKVFWLPHNMDFRGRVYPVPPHLNHLGSDLARSILVFAEARPLGPDGFNWLKLHLINLTGLKKRDPVAERLKYADEVMDLILDSADRPLDGAKWWQESDEPWQTLACCMEIANAMRSGNPETYLTHFPIHQDGSCNGLQHYAALGRDKAGAYSVNLTPDSKPQDVYSAVVALVEEQREKDAENGLKIAQVLNGFVKRKVIKQTVMTTVYGVTRYGARLQIARQLKDIDEFPKEHVWAASHYLTACTFESLRTMFTSTKEIQDWFTECARLISAVGEHQVEWVTPIGLPVVQPYFRNRKLNIRNGFESYPIDTYEKPNVMKQKNAFPPNFIHSLDSSHMMLTSMHCERAGITFVSVHDCYWTHPSTVHIMNRICRDQFVALHSEPILEDLSMFLTKKFSYSESDLAGDGSVMDLTKRKLNRILKRIPPKGNFDINEVLESVYFFS